MTFDEVTNALFMIARLSYDDEIKEQVYLLGRSVNQRDGSIPGDVYPFDRLVNNLASLADQTRYAIDKIELMTLRDQLLTEGIEGHVEY